MPLLFKINIWYNFILFIGNSFLRIILFKKKSFIMLKKRAIGFFNNEFKHTW